MASLRTLARRLSLPAELRGRVLWVVIGCFVVQLGVGYGYAGAPLAAFLIDEFGWTRVEVAATRAAQPLLLSLASPLVGFLTLRFGARFVLASGAVVLGTTFMLGSQVETRAHLVGMWAAQGLSVTLLGDIAVGAVVSQWTRRSRALALGIAYTGANVGGALSARALVAVAEVTSWRTALFALGVAALVVILPAALWLVRDRLPGRSREGAAGTPVEAPTPGPPEVALSARRALATRSFWVLVFAHLSYWLFLLLVLEGFVLMLQDRGVPRAEATAHLANATLVGGAAKVGFGLLALRMSPRSAMLVNYGLLVVASLLLLFIDRPGAVAAFVWVYGVGYAARDVAAPLAIAHCFGVGAVAPVYGLLMLTFLVSPLGGILGGLSHDRTGSYEPAIMGIGALLVVSFLALFLLRDERDEGEGRGDRDAT